MVSLQHDTLLLTADRSQTTAFCKFLPVIIVLYLGFLTTFTMLARDRLTLNEVSWLLVKVFFGSSYLGFVSNRFIVDF